MCTDPPGFYNTIQAKKRYTSILTVGFCLLVPRLLYDLYLVGYTIWSIRHICLDRGTIVQRIKRISTIYLYRDINVSTRHRFRTTHKRVLNRRNLSWDIPAFPTFQNKQNEKNYPQFPVLIWFAGTVEYLDIFVFRRVDRPNDRTNTSSGKIPRWLPDIVKTMCDT